MPRKTTADKASASARFHREKMQAAYQSPEIDAPLTVAMQWLYSALAQAARENPSEAATMYRHATDQIAAYADTVQHRTAARDGK